METYSQDKKVALNFLVWELDGVSLAVAITWLVFFEQANHISHNYRQALDSVVELFWFWFGLVTPVQPFEQGIFLTPTLANQL